MADIRDAIAHAIMMQQSGAPQTAASIPAEFSGGLGDWQRYVRNFDGGFGGGDDGGFGGNSFGGGSPPGGGPGQQGGGPGSFGGQQQGGQQQSGQQQGGQFGGANSAGALTGALGGAGGAMTGGPNTNSMVDQGFNNITTGPPDNPGLAASLAGSQQFSNGQPVVSDPYAALGIGPQGQSLYGSNPGNNPFGTSQPSVGAYGTVSPYGGQNFYGNNYGNNPFASYNQAGAPQFSFGRGEVAPQFFGNAPQFGGFGDFGWGGWGDEGLGDDSDDSAGDDSGDGAGDDSGDGAGGDD